MSDRLTWRLQVAVETGPRETWSLWCTAREGLGGSGPSQPCSLGAFLQEGLSPLQHVPLDPSSSLRRAKRALVSRSSSAKGTRDKAGCLTSVHWQAGAIHQHL